MAVTVSGMSITFNDGTVQTTAAGIPTISAGANYYAVASGVSASANSTSYAKRSQYRTLVAGTYRILAQNNAPWGPADGVANIIRFYKNGVAVSGEYSTSSSSFTLVTYDITLAVGDLIQLYGRNSNGVSYITQGDLIGIGLSAASVTAQLMAGSPFPRGGVYA